MSIMADSHHTPADADKSLIGAIALILFMYIGAVLAELPAIIPSAHAEAHHAPAAPPLPMVAPFVLLLGCIAVLPLIKRTEHWWESNLHRFYVSAGLSLLTLGYYQWAGGFPGVADVLDHAILAEYVPFITLLFSLYVISGGIRIECDLPAHPVTNCGFIAIGGLLASFIGTTGSAMLLIRPLLETNSQRRHVRHTVIFFIFVVCNCGGCLLPIGDPPLFLGYLEGVDFFWTLNLWGPWLFVNALLLLVYIVWDRMFCYPKETKADIQRDETRVRPVRISGWKLNGLLLIGVVFSVALLDPKKELPLTHWHPWHFLREIVQIGLVAISLIWGCKFIREKNRFNYHAIIEVAVLFLGIFVCMQPALAILDVQGPSLGVDTPQKFFWATGGLSAVLDNAPTYLVFFKTAGALEVTGTAATAGIQESLLIAISLGAVFMGAMTYIGNGPNFMVKAIAEKSGIRMPSFFGYMIYSMAVLLPILAVTTLVFL